MHLQVEFTRVNKEKDGSLIYDSKEVENHIRNILNKKGMSKEMIEKSLREHSEAKTGTDLILSSGMRVKKASYSEIWQKPGPSRLDHRVIALLAYNFLCLLKGNTIFVNHFDGIRDFLLNGNMTDQVKIEEFPYTNSYAPYHRLWIESENDSTMVFILLFGSIVLKLSIKNVVIPGGNYIFIMDLLKRKIHSAMSFEEANNGEIFST